jgi:hypothetical protein
MTVKRRLLALLVGAAAAGGAPRPARAHPEASAAGTSRYVTAAVAGGRIEISDAWLLGTLPAAEERRRLDADGDGTISAAEQARAEAAAAAEPPALAVALDGAERTAAATVVVDLGGERDARDAPLVIERRMTLERAAGVGRGPEQLRLAVLREPARLVETEMSVDLASGLVLRGPPDRVRWRGPRASALEDRSVTFIFGPPPHRPQWRTALFVAAAVLALAALVSGARARRTPRI